MRINDTQLKEPLDAFQLQPMLDELRNIFKSFTILTGAEEPIGNVKGDIGDFYIQKNKSSDTAILYFKESGAGRSTGWVVK